jgi:hypothetical protein
VSKKTEKPEKQEKKLKKLNRKKNRLEYLKKPTSLVLVL